MSGDLLSRIALLKAVPFEQAIRAVGTDLGLELPDELPGWIRCPIHGEKTPSLNVKVDFWYCHGSCKKGGDALDLLVEVEGLTLREAVARLEALLGLSSDAAEAAVARARAAELPASSVREAEAWAKKVDEVADEFRVRVHAYGRSPDPVVDGIASGPLEWVLEELRDAAASDPPLVSRARRERLRELRAWALGHAAGIERAVLRATGKDRLDVAAAAGNARELEGARELRELALPLRDSVRVWRKARKRKGRKP